MTFIRFHVLTRTLPFTAGVRPSGRSKSRKGAALPETPLAALFWSTTIKPTHKFIFTTRSFRPSPCSPFLAIVRDSLAVPPQVGSPAADVVFGERLQIGCSHVPLFTVFETVTRRVCVNQPSSTHRARVRATAWICDIAWLGRHLVTFPTARLRERVNTK